MGFRGLHYFGPGLAPMLVKAVEAVQEYAGSRFRICRYTDYDLFYAVAQKNLGPAGVTLVCIRKALLDRMNPNLPPVYSYHAHVAAGRVLNTLPVFAIFVCLLMLRWTATQGVSLLHQRNRQKSEILYAALEKSPLFNLPVLPAYHLVMNCIWTAQNKQTENAFLAFA